MLYPRLKFVIRKPNQSNYTAILTQKLLVIVKKKWFANYTIGI